MEKDLYTHRKSASDQSLGSSSQAIYDKAYELLETFGEGAQHMDFGSGRGEFLKQVHSKNQRLQLTGVDLMEKPIDCASAIQWISADLNDSLKIADGAFHSITAIEIIEHLENPRHVFRELYRVLKKGGVLILSTPNNESWRSMVSYLYRGHFVAFTDSSYPAHITPLNRKDLLRSAKEAGFEFLRWDYTDKGCVPGITAMSWQQLSFGVLQGLRYSDNLFVVLTK